MLVLSRKVGERIQVGDKITITVVKVSGGNVRIGIDAPHEWPIMRGELADKLQAEETGKPVAPATSGE